MQNLGETDHNGPKQLTTKIFIKFEHSSLLTLIAKENKKGSGL